MPMPDLFRIKKESLFQARQFRSRLGATRHEAGHHVLGNSDVARQSRPLLRSEDLKFARPCSVRLQRADAVSSHGKLADLTKDIATTGSVKRPGGGKESRKR